jgi:hypothetical protein
MLPHYQNRTLEYDNRIDRQINQRLKKKFANLAPVNFTATNQDAEAVFTNLEKMLFLIFALLQEAQTYLFETANHENDITEMADDYTEPSAISYRVAGDEPSLSGSGSSDSGSSDSGSIFSSEGSSSFDRNSQFLARQRARGMDMDDDSSSFDRNSQFLARQQAMGMDMDDDSSSFVSSFRPPNLNDITRAQKVVSTISSFRSVLSKIIQQTPSLSNLVKQITPLFGYLNQTQVTTLQEIVLASIRMFNEIARAVTQDLGETNSERTALFKSLELINDGIIQKNLTMIGRLVQSYNPIIVPFNASIISDVGSGYSLANGVDNGQYV